MKIRISQLRQKLDDYQLPLEQLAARALRVKPGDVMSAKLVRKSVDARDKGDVHFTLTLDVETARPVRLPGNAAILEAAATASVPPAAGGLPPKGNVINLTGKDPLSAPAGHLSPSRGRGKESDERGLFLARPREGESWRVAPERGLLLYIDDIPLRGSCQHG